MARGQVVADAVIAPAQREPTADVAADVDEAAPSEVALAAAIALVNAPAADADEVMESPRERGRVLQKRNPIASEYQVPGSLGRSPGASADGEGNDFASFFPATGSLIGSAVTPDRVTLGFTYQELSGAGEPGFDARWGRRGGRTGERWAIDLRAGVNAADRLIEHYEAAWATTAAAGGAAPVYYLQRPRISQDSIATRARSAGLHLERELGRAHTGFFQVLWSDYDDDFYRNRLELNTGKGALVAGSAEVAAGSTTQTAGAYAGGGARRYFSRSLTARDIVRLQAGGRWAAEGWTIDYAAYHASWKSGGRSDGWNFFDTGLDLRYEIVDPYFPRLAVTNGVDLNDTSAALFNDLRATESATADTDWAGRVDLERKLSLAGGTAWLGAGVLHRQKERINDSDTDVYFQDPAARFGLDAVDYGAAPGPVVDGRYEILPVGLDPNAGRARVEAGGPGLVRSEARSIIESAQTRYTSAEEVQGAYVNGTWRRGIGEVTAGLRAERTATESLGTVISPVEADAGIGAEVGRTVDNGSEVVIREVPGANAYSTWLPSVAASARLSKAWAVRATYFEQLMRPQYFDTVAYRRVNPPTLTLSEGNPSLRPTTIRSLAAAVDYTAPWAGEFAAEVYRIAVTDFFYDAQNFVLIDGALYTASRVENGDDGTITGFQVQWSRGWESADLGRFKPAVAYTYSDSEATLPTRPSDRLMLPERSRHLLRTSLTWSRGKLGATADVSYQNLALDEVGPSLERDGYRDTVFALNLNLWWRPTSTDRLTLGIGNLTDAPERSYEGDPRRATRNQYASRTWRAGWEKTF